MYTIFCMNQTNFAMSAQNRKSLQLPNGIKKKIDPQTILKRMSQSSLPALVNQIQQHKSTCWEKFGSSMAPNCDHGTTCTDFLCQKIRGVQITLSRSELTLREIVMQTFILRAALEPQATDVLKATFLQLVQKGLRLI